MKRITSIIGSQMRTEGITGRALILQVSATLIFVLVVTSLFPLLELAVANTYGIVIAQRLPAPGTSFTTSPYKDERMVRIALAAVDRTFTATCTQPADRLVTFIGVTNFWSSGPVVIPAGVNCVVTFYFFKKVVGQPLTWSVN